MNQAAKNNLALVISLAYGTGAVHVGDSSQRQADTDTDIIGTLLASAPTTFTAQGDLIQASVNVPFTADATAQEIAFLDTDGNLIDRFIIPQTAVRAGGSLSLVWTMEVL